DQWSADRFIDKNAPDFLLVDFVDIDGRNIVLDTPATWRAILQNYEFVKGKPRGLQLLKRRGSMSMESLSEIGTTTIEKGKWLTVPRSEGLVYAFIDMKLNYTGWINKEAFRVPPVHLASRSQTGIIRQYRIIPDTARDGLLVNVIPDNVEQLVGVFSHASLDRV